MEEFGLFFNFTEEGKKITTAQESTIQEENEVFSIGKTITLKEENLDPAFKELVDTVLKK